jgi:hypothetical protein
MTKQEFIDYMIDYGTHVQFQYGDNFIQKKISLTPYNSSRNHFPHKSKGRKSYMEFQLNGKDATIEECIDIINKYNRDKKIESILKD